MLTVREVTPEFEDILELEKIFHEAFPPEERIGTFEQMLSSSAFDFVTKAYYSNGRLIGALVITHMEAFDYGFYLAVHKDLRNCGYGGEIFDAQIAECKDKPFVFAIEDPDEECGNRDQRLRREAFYLRHDCVYAGCRGRIMEEGITFKFMTPKKTDNIAHLIEENLSRSYPLGSILVDP